MRKECASHLFAVAAIVGSSVGSSVGSCGGIDSNIETRDERSRDEHPDLRVTIEHQKAEPPSAAPQKKLLQNE